MLKFFPFPGGDEVGGSKMIGVIIVDIPQFVTGIVQSIRVMVVGELRDDSGGTDKYALLLAADSGADNVPRHIASLRVDRV